jgi:hypothetical protein
MDRKALLAWGHRRRTGEMVQVKCQLPVDDRLGRGQTRTAGTDVLRLDVHGDHAWR